MGNSKVIFWGFILILAAVALPAQDVDYLSGPKKAEADTEVGTISVARANIRYGPTTNSRIVVTLSKGDKVTVYSKEGEWYAIAIPSQGHVWVFNDYVDVLGNDGTINANRVSLRNDARYESTVIGQVDKGVRIRVVAQKGKWLRIVPLPHLRAYIHEKLVSLSGPEFKESTKYWEGMRSEMIFRSDWQQSPDSKYLQSLDKQLWAIKASVKQSKSTMEELENAIKDIEEIETKIKAKIGGADNEGSKAFGGIVLRKAGKIKEYVQAVIDFRKNIGDIEKRAKEEIARINAPKTATDDPSGYIDDVGRIIGRPSPFVLKKGDEILCFLKSGKPCVVITANGENTVEELNFKDYYFKEVKIIDSTRGKDVAGIPTLTVTRLEIKGSLEWPEPEKIQKD
ncbi:SH3 domain-containing protein [Planctomycetota bacterium]